MSLRQQLGTCQLLYVCVAVVNLGFTLLVLGVRLGIGGTMSPLFTAPSVLQALGEGF